MTIEVRRIPLFADATLPPLILLVRWLGILQYQGITAVSLERLPPGNGSLPDLLQLGGITQLELQHAPVSMPFIWEGCAGARVQVGASQSPDRDLPIHHGHLPVDHADIEHVSAAILGLVDLARLEDANAMLSQSPGAAWQHILAAAGMEQSPRIPPLATHATSDEPGQLGAWNPLPFIRQVPIALPQPAGPAPWALSGASGARHQVQVVEGPLGRELLTSARMRALECVTFATADDPVAGGHWEVSRTVLDNGRVRAEFDPLGQVVRLCFAGHFIALSGPALHAQIDGLPFSGASNTVVLEEGPVRARVAVTRTGALGTLHLIYTLHAHEDLLRISASWDGQSELVLDHPTSHRGAMLTCAGELASWQVEQRLSVLRSSAPLQHGLRWAMLAEAGGDGVALASARPLTASAQAGHLRVHLDRAVSYALGSVQGGSAATNLPRTSLALAVPGRRFNGDPTLRGSSPLQTDERLACWWISRPTDWNGELLLSEWMGRRTSAMLMHQGLRDHTSEAWRVNAAGMPVAKLQASAEGDGFQIDMQPFEIALVRWR